MNTFNFVFLISCCLVTAIAFHANICEDLVVYIIPFLQRSGRIEEEIELLQHKLKNIEEGRAFGGAKTKMARSQGKKIQITIEQEKSR